MVYLSNACANVFRRNWLDMIRRDKNLRSDQRPLDNPHACMSVVKSQKTLTWDLTVDMLVMSIETIVLTSAQLVKISIGD